MAESEPRALVSLLQLSGKSDSWVEVISYSSADGNPAQCGLSNEVCVAWSPTHTVACKLFAVSSAHVLVVHAGSSNLIGIANLIIRARLIQQLVGEGG